MLGGVPAAGPPAPSRNGDALGASPELGAATWAVRLECLERRFEATLQPIASSGGTACPSTPPRGERGLFPRQGRIPRPELSLRATPWRAAARRGEELAGAAGRKLPELPDFIAWSRRPQIRSSLLLGSGEEPHGLRSARVHRLEPPPDLRCLGPPTTDPLELIAWGRRRSSRTAPLGAVDPPELNHPERPPNHPNSIARSYCPICTP